MDTAFCPHCYHRLNLEGYLQIGQSLRCPACKAQLEIISIAPIEVDWQYREPERLSSQDSMQLDSPPKYSHQSVNKAE